MRDKEKAPAGVPAPTRAEGKGLPTGFPYSDFNTAIGNRQFKAGEVGGENSGHSGSSDAL